MNRKNIGILLAFAALALTAVGGSCDIARSLVKLSDLDQALQTYQNGKWDGVKSSKISYVTGINQHVANWDKQSAITYASLAHAQHVIQVAAASVTALQKTPNVNLRQVAQHNVKLAQNVLLKAAGNAPKLLQDGKDLMNNYRSLVSDPLQAAKVAEALKDSLNNLTKTVENAPEALKKLGQISQRLANL
jgi:hypothetical protein